jgi:phage shock protein A
MDESVAAELERIKTRLVTITDEREHVPAEESDSLEALSDEEHRLETRLAELKDQLVEEDAGDAEQQAASQTDITRTPRLPDTESND